MPGDTALARALALVRDLRARCPWDRAQTRATLRPYLVEEALELDQALKLGDAARLRDELGDVLLHCAFQIVIGEERGEFDAEAVTRALEDKMRRRHPKLFGDSATPDHEGWERAKQRERGAGSGTLRGLAPSPPPLLLAYRSPGRGSGERPAPWLATVPATPPDGVSSAGAGGGRRVRLAGCVGTDGEGERRDCRAGAGHGKGETGKVGG